MNSRILLPLLLLFGTLPIMGHAAPCADSYAFMDPRALPAQPALSFPTDYLTVEAIGPRGERLRYPAKIVERFIEDDRESRFRILVYHRGKRQIIEANLKVEDVARLKPQRGSKEIELEIEEVLAARNTPPLRFGTFETPFLMVNSRNAMGITTSMPAEIVEVGSGPGASYTLRMYDSTVGQFTERTLTPQQVRELKAVPSARAKKEIEDFKRRNPQ